jgi:ParB-like chromosome segregation protein Spo0J
MTQRMKKPAKQPRSGEAAQSSDGSSPKKHQPSHVAAPIVAPALEPHPLAEKFPAMAEVELDRLIKDIKENGLRQPITLNEGKILDGRNRYAACLLAGVSPRFEQFTGPDPVSFVLARNLYRRHLSPSQLSAVAADFLALYSAEAAKRRHQLSGTRKNPDGTTPGGGGQVRANLPQPARARAQAADALGVSERSVQDAAAVKAIAPELFEQVKAGKFSLAKAKSMLPKRPIPVRAPKSQRKGSGFTVVVWNQEKQTDTASPLKFFPETDYPDLVLFHIWPAGVLFLPPPARSRYQLLLTAPLPTEDWKNIAGVTIAIISRLVSVLVRGAVPPQPEALPSFGDIDFLMDSVKEAWPDARKVLRGFPPRDGFESLPIS